MKKIELLDNVEDIAKATHWIHKSCEMECGLVSGNFYPILTNWRGEEMHRYIQVGDEDISINWICRYCEGEFAILKEHHGKRV